MASARARERKEVERRYVSVSELAVRWSISPSAIYARKCGTHALTPIRLGRSVRFLRKQIEELEKARERQVPTIDTEPEYR